MKTIRLSFAQNAEDKVPYNQSEQCMNELIQANQFWDTPPPNTTQNIWSAALSSGEKALSLAIVYEESEGANLKPLIYALDNKNG